MKYMAEDGKVFETRVECELYEKDIVTFEENAIDDIKKNVILYTGNGTQISYDRFDNLHFFNDLAKCVKNDCYFIKVLHDLTTSAESVYFPTGAGTYRWTTDAYNEWIDIDDDIDMFIDNWKSIFPNLRVVKGE